MVGKKRLKQREYLNEERIMEYRKLEKLNIQTSLLGFGCMRFPVLENGKIDEVEAEKMLDLAIS